MQNLLSRGFSLEQSIKILEKLKDSAAFNRQSQLSMGEAVKSATEGIKNENSVLVDNAGVTKNVSIMWKEYAGSIGKGVDTLKRREDVVIKDKKEESDKKKLAEDWEKDKGKLQLDIDKTGLDEYDQKILELKKKTKELNTTYKDIPEAKKIIIEWEFKEFNKIVDEKEKKALDARIKVYKNITAAKHDELAKQLAAEDDWLFEQEKLLIESFNSQEEINKKLIEAERVTADKKEKITDEYFKKIYEKEKAVEEARINLELDRVDLKENKKEISETAAVRERLSLTRELIKIQEEFLTKIDKNENPEEFTTQTGVIVGLQKKEADLLNMSKELQGTIENALSKIIDKLSDAKSAIGTMIEFAIIAAGKIKDKMSDKNATADGDSKLMAFAGKISGIVGLIIQLVQAIANLPEILMNFIKSISITVYNFSDNLIKLITDVIAKIPAAAGEMFTKFSNDIDKIIVSILKAIPKIIKQLIMGGILTVAASVEEIPQIIAALIKEIPAFVSSLIYAIWEGIKTILVG